MKRHHKPKPLYDRFVMRPILLGFISFFVSNIGVAQAAQMKFGVAWPKGYTQECVLDRSSLAATVLARNLELYPDMAIPTGSGWLIHDRYLRQVVELDEDLTIVRYFGQTGEGPLEYGEVVALLKVNELVVVVDESPPSVLVFGDEEIEHRLDVIPVDIGLHEGKVLLADRDGDIHELSLSTGERSLLHSRTDFGLSKPRGEGALPEVRLRHGYAGFVGTSTVWALSPGVDKLAQRCIHDDLAAMHHKAPRMDLGEPFGIQRYTLLTMEDFAPVAGGGFIVLGRLLVKDTGGLRSIERYDVDGNLSQAWQLEEYPRAHGRFDQDPHRLLIWSDEIDGIRLVEIDANIR